MFQGQHSPVSSKTATTARISSVNANYAESGMHTRRRNTLGQKNVNSSQQQDNRQQYYQDHLKNQNVNLLNDNNTSLNNATPIFDPLHNNRHVQLQQQRHMNLSQTNENVVFKERKDFSSSKFLYMDPNTSIETTTEL